MCMEEYVGAKARFSSHVVIRKSKETKGPSVQNNWQQIMTLVTCKIFFSELKMLISVK